MGFGVSFLDDQESQGQNKGDRYQEAVEVLTMRVPRVVGGGAFAPAPLLQGMGGAGSPFAQSAIQQAMAQMAGLPQQMGGAPRASQAPHAMGPRRPQGPQPVAPTPRFVPGIDTMAAPAPQGQPTREWQQPAQDAPIGQATGELETAAARASRGYNPAAQLQEMMRGWGTRERGFL
jgi:hypothetical protein